MNDPARRTPLDDDELARYRRDGFVVLGQIVGQSEVDGLLEAEARFRPDYAYAAPGVEPHLLVREQLCNQSVAVRDFCFRGAHLTCVAQVLGPDVAFTHTQFITKLPDGPGHASHIPLHQDDGYGRLEPPLDATVWTALTDTDERNGCLFVIPGSHRGGVVPHHRFADNAALQEAIGDGAVPVPLPAGHAVLFSGLTLHGSGPNHTERPRIGLHARYCHPCVRMVTEGNRPVLDDPHSCMVLGEAPPAD